MSHKPPHDPWVKPVMIVSSLCLLATVGILSKSLVSTISANSTIGTLPIKTAHAATTETPTASTEEQAAKDEPAAEETKATTETAETTSSEPASASASHAGINGEKVYKGLCFSCHDMGIAGAPKVGDPAAWTDRIAAGNESMYNIAINGKGAMPAKGGNPSLSDDEIKAAVDYMVSTVQ